VRGDVQDAGTGNTLDRGFSGLVCNEERGVWKQRFERPHFGAHAGQRSEEDLRIIHGSRRTCCGLAKRRIGDDDSGSSARAAHLQSQQVASTGQVANREAFDQITAALVDERGEGHEVERAVGRHQQMHRSAQQVSDRLHQHRVHRTRQVPDVGPGRIAERESPGFQCAIDARGLAQIHPPCSLAGGHDVRRIAGRELGTRRGTRRVIEAEFD
jgi:hypothetical protein